MQLGKVIGMLQKAIDDAKKEPYTDKEMLAFSEAVKNAFITIENNINGLENQISELKKKDK